MSGPENELAACPFCGGDAELRSWDWPYVRFQVRCAVCKSHARARMATETKARKAWNQRASLATRPAKVDEDAIALALATSKARWSGGDLATAADIQRYLEMASTRHHAANIATALTQAPRSCCADERERCAKIADEYAAHFALGRAAMRSMQEKAVCYDKMKTAEAIATAIRSNSHD